LGSFIADGKGMTLYMFTTDTATTSSCSGPCLNLWPPLLTTGPATVGTGLDASKVTTLTRSDGSKQVVYGAWPLYYYAPDTAAGETKGQGVGGKWYVVGADGKEIGRPAS
jgi:predicted lipoprotein with Yx(FWY)xxD motif